MATYSYICTRCGEFDRDYADDVTACRCGLTAKRRYQVQVIGSSLKSQSRWDPVVGAYVRNDAEFRSLLHEGQDRQSEIMNMECVLATCDARDGEALAELHGVTTDSRAEELEPVKKAEWEKART